MNDSLGRLVTLGRLVALALLAVPGPANALGEVAMTPMRPAPAAPASVKLAARAGISVSLARWTGSELPGSIPNTFKYRLVVTGAAGTNVTLRARRVPKTWIASFCSDKVCAPMHVGVAIPKSGTKVVEFQLVPPGSERAAPKVLVTGSDGRTEATAST